jgi:hypothetical protein
MNADAFRNLFRPAAQPMLQQILKAFHHPTPTVSTKAKQDRPALNPAKESPFQLAPPSSANHERC